MISSMVSFANFAKINTSLVEETSLNKFAAITTDSIISISPQYGEMSLEQELSYVAFYNIDHLTITNNNKKYIRVVDNNGKIVLESHDSIDIILPDGNYYVYTTSQNLKGIYK